MSPASFISLILLFLAAFLGLPPRFQRGSADPAVAGRGIAEAAARRELGPGGAALTATPPPAAQAGAAQQEGVT